MSPGDGNTTSRGAHPNARMSLEVAQVVVFLAQGYGGAGLAFALAFLPLGAPRVDRNLVGSPLAVRVLILPGVVIFWPLLAWRWARR